MQQPPTLALPSPTLSPLSGTFRGFLRLLTWVLGVEHLQSVHHGASKNVSVLLAAKVEAVDLAGIPPLVEGQRGLVVLQPLGDGAVDHHLQVGRRGEEERRGDDSITDCCYSTGGEGTGEERRKQEELGVEWKRGKQRR